MLPASYRRVTLPETLSQIQKLAAAFEPARWIFSCCGKEACDGCSGPSTLIKAGSIEGETQATSLEDPYADFFDLDDSLEEREPEGREQLHALVGPIA